MNPLLSVRMAALDIAVGALATISSTDQKDFDSDKAISNGALLLAARVVSVFVMSLLLAAPPNPLLTLAATLGVWWLVVNKTHASKVSAAEANSVLMRMAVLVVVAAFSGIGA